jgi:2-hydroxychromene-2-carboxylate isomerase
VIGAIIDELGRSSAAVLARAATPGIKDRLRAQTDEAMARGIFGAPSFTVGNELFWGNDRLEQAVEWAKEGRAA